MKVQLPRTNSAADNPHTRVIAESIDYQVHNDPPLQHVFIAWNMVPNDERSRARHV